MVGDDLAIAVEPAPIVRGTVTDSQSKPVPNANIRMQISDKEGYLCTNLDDEIKTDLHGQYQLPALPPLVQGHIYRVDISAYIYIQKADYTQVRTISSEFEIEPNDLIPGEVLIKDVTLK